MENLVCPLTHKIFNQPVTVRDGVTYEQQAIKKWRLSQTISPCGIWIPDKFLINDQLLAQVQKYLKENPDMRKHQYQLSITHLDNLDIVNQIIENDNYNELLDYQQFDSSQWSDEVFKKLIKLGSREVIQHLVQESQNITPHHIKLMITCCSVEIIQSLIDQKIPITQYNLLWQKMPSLLPYLIDHQLNPKLIQFIMTNIQALENLIPQIIEKNVYVNLPDDCGEAVIHHLLSRSKNQCLIQQLIDSGVDLELSGKDGMKPIHYAIKYQTQKIVQYLMDQGIELNCHDNFGLRPIHYGLISGNVQMVEQLLLSIDLKVEDDKFELIELICRQLRPDKKILYFSILELLSQKCHNFSHLHYLLMIPNISLEMIKTTIDQQTIKKMDLNHRTNDGWSPLHVAIYKNYLNIAKYLIELGIDLDSKTNQGFTVLDLALKKKSDLKFIEYLVMDKNVDVSQINIKYINCGQCSIHLDWPGYTSFQRGERIEGIYHLDKLRPLMKFIWEKNGRPGKVPSSKKSNDNQCLII